MSAKDLWEVKLGTRGRITIPMEVRQKMNLKPGQKLVLRTVQHRKGYYIYIGRHLDEIFHQIGIDDFRRRYSNE